jgi:hypothetical protein
METAATTQTRSQDLYLRAKQLIPGGTQLLSKRPEMFLPDHWPAYYEKAKGCDVWDLDGRQYMDAAYMGVGANLLGYANDVVDNAVIDSIRKGTNTTLNAPEEVELAELLLDLHPWAEQVRYTKTGGEAMAVAVRICRAATGKNKVLFCGYHGWHDWYISSNLADDKLGDGHLIPGLEPNGVPRQLLNTAIPFTYNQTDEFLEKLNQHGDEVACIVVESVRNFNPDPEFFATLRREATARGIVLVLDEITAGFRINIGGAHLRFDEEPDIQEDGTVKMDPLQAEVRAEVAREHALTMMENEICEYPQWFPGVQNVIADALSRDDDRDDETLTNLLISHFPEQVSSHFKIVQLPKEISAWLTSVLQKLPVREQLQEQHTRTKIGLGPDSPSTSKQLEYTMTLTSTTFKWHQKDRIVGAFAQAMREGRFSGLIL